MRLICWVRHVASAAVALKSRGRVLTPGIEVSSELRCESDLFAEEDPQTSSGMWRHSALIDHFSSRLNEARPTDEMEIIAERINP